MLDLDKPMGFWTYWYWTLLDPIGPIGFLRALEEGFFTPTI